MRMWMVNPKLLCNKHLLGEHGEIHKFKHTFEKQYKIDRRVSPVVQIVPQKMENRHNELANEMLNRGMNHKSPYTLPDISYLPLEYLNKSVDLDYNLQDLCSRCQDCNTLISKNNYSN